MSTITAQDEAREELLKLLRPNQRVYCILRSVAKSGMSRRIDFYTIVDGEMRFLSGYIGTLLGMSRSAKSDGLLVHGCGMDAGFHVVYELGYKLWPKGTQEPHGTRNGKPDSGGGYALKHYWL